MTDVPPPGAGVNTVMLNVPAVSKSLAGIDAVNCVALIYVVVRVEPANRTTEVDTKSVPFTVSVKAVSPTVLLVGEMLDTVGTLFSTVKV